MAITKFQFTSGKQLQTAALLLATILLSGCGDNHQARIVGTWRLQTVDELAKRVGDDSPNSESTLETSQKSTGQDALNADEVESRNMLVEFESNGALKTRTQLGTINNDKIGKWKFIQYNEETEVVSIDCTIGLQTTQHDVKIIDDDCIEMVPPNMAGLKTKLRFERSERSISR